MGPLYVPVIFKKGAEVIFKTEGELDEFAPDKASSQLSVFNSAFETLNRHIKFNLLPEDAAEQFDTVETKGLYGASVSFSREDIETLKASVAAEQNLPREQTRPTKSPQKRHPSKKMP